MVVLQDKKRNQQFKLCVGKLSVIKIFIAQLLLIYHIVGGAKSGNGLHECSLCQTLGHFSFFKLWLKIFFEQFESLDVDFEVFYTNSCLPYCGIGSFISFCSFKECAQAVVFDLIVYLVS